MTHSRRAILLGGAAAVTLANLKSSSCAAEADPSPPIATNTYPWLTFARRESREFDHHADPLLADIATTGIVGYEPIVTATSELSGLGLRLKDHGLEMKSIYVNSVLHDAEKVDQSIAEVVEIAAAAKALGTQIVVTNPSPIRWGGPDDKTDDQLRLQAKSLDLLGAELRKLDLTLAYHNHDAELRQGGREFHHMLTATDPDHVKLCLDAHWIYRGCGNSEVAVFDALTHYHGRIVELHLRQSKAGVWAESFSMNGNIDYERLFDYLVERSIRPHLVLEQAVEDASPHRLSVVEAHRQSNSNLRRAILPGSF
ncbi:MAG: sugar phosphate isomerase/epimerase [Rubripirellula sp.]